MSKKRKVAMSLFLLVTASMPLRMAKAQETTPPSSSAPKSHRMPMMRRLSYTCDGGAKLMVSLREKNARISFAGKSYALKQVQAASGTKYSDGQIVWWSKGEEGFLEDDTKPDQPVKLAENCKLERRKPAEAAVSGTVAYRERMAMPEDAVLTMQLQDVSLADVPATVIAEQKFTFAGHQVPLPFEVPYDAAKINAKHSYALSAQITVGGQLLFLNTTTYRVITQGNPMKVDMTVQMVEGQTNKD